MKGKTKAIITVFVVILAGIYYYAAIPAINIHSSETWFFIMIFLTDQHTKDRQKCTEFPSPQTIDAHPQKIVPVHPITPPLQSLPAVSFCAS